MIWFGSTFSHLSWERRVSAESGRRRDEQEKARVSRHTHDRRMSEPSWQKSAWVEIGIGGPASTALRGSFRSRQHKIGKCREAHRGFYELFATVDYVLAQIHGGTAEPDNLVTTSMTNNMKKRDAPIDVKMGVAAAGTPPTMGRSHWLVS
jgi:hypothetical protein